MPDEGLVGISPETPTGCPKAFSGSGTIRLPRRLPPNAAPPAPADAETDSHGRMDHPKKPLRTKG